MKIKFQPQGVCCREMFLDISDDNKIVGAGFQGGCGGNLQGIARLIYGLDVEEVIKRLKGINCGGKGTSCPDQLAIGLEKYLEFKKAKAMQNNG
ncbi:TIGR03905 family TSCPD domain-containing protein [bacterium]|nr:TIGR03905 family TSCPD domain-containing protein [bacterium]